MVCLFVVSYWLDMGFLANDSKIDLKAYTSIFEDVGGGVVLYSD